MYSPLHASVGLLLAQAMPNAPVAFAAGVVSHYLLDAIPHGDLRPLAVLSRMPKGKMLAVVVPIDLTLAALITWWLGAQLGGSANLWWGALGGIAPDLLWGGQYLLERLRFRLPVIMPLLQAHHVIHEGLHVKTKHDIPHRYGIAYQLILLGGLVWFYLF